MDAVPEPSEPLSCEPEPWRQEAAAEKEEVIHQSTDKGGAATSEAIASFETSAATDAAKAQDAAGTGAGSKSDATRTTPAPLRHLPSLSNSGTGMAVLPGEPNPYNLPVFSHIVFAYRISSGGYAKHKPEYVSKETCLLNFVAAATTFTVRYPKLPVRCILIKDACTDELASVADTALNVVLRKANPDLVVDEHVTAFGSGAASFLFALDAVRALALPRDTTAVYLVEDDYLHTKDALSVILGGLALAPYVTGYDHPDKYVDNTAGGNPLVFNGGEVTRVYRGADRHWRGTNSTTMTFASTLCVLVEDDTILRTFSKTAPSDDLHMFLALGTTRGRLLISPMPAVSTHGETAFLSPFVSWEKLGKQAAEFVAVLQGSSTQVQAKTPTPTPIQPSTSTEGLQPKGSKAKRRHR